MRKSRSKNKKNINPKIKGNFQFILNDRIMWVYANPTASLVQRGLNPNQDWKIVLNGKTIY